MPDGYVEESRYTVENYFRLVGEGVLDARDRVELLEGVIVAEPPMDPPHAAAIDLVARALREAVGDGGLVRVQAPLVVVPFSVPEPDVAVVAGAAGDYSEKHPSTALLVVEVAASSLQQDRLSKSRIYAAAAVPEYWIVNLRDACVEVFRGPDVRRRVYADRQAVARGGEIVPVSLPQARIATEGLFPKSVAA